MRGQQDNGSLQKQCPRETENAPETLEGRMKYRKKNEKEKEYQREIDLSFLSVSVLLEPHY